jgi:hypothetical protein
VSERHRKFLRLVAAWAFPLALWLVATGWYGFDLGKYSDDWAISLRSPETDIYQWPASPFIRWDYFWRPLHLLTVYGLATAFWHHDWLNHLVSALAHLGVGLLLYRLLRQLGIAAAAARCALCIFLVIPVSIEAVLWPAALGSVVGVGWFLLIVMMCVRRARAKTDLSGAARWKWLGSLAAMGFLTACWHEQPAACVLALPALFLAASEDVARAFRRGLAATAACGAGVGAYIALFVATVPAGRRGGSNTLVGADALGDRLLRLATMAWDLSFGGRARDTTLDAFETGSKVMRASPLGVAACMVLLLIAAASVLAMARDGKNGSVSASAPSPPIRPAWLALFGIAAALASLAPIALVTWQPMHPRYLYGAGAGLAIVLATALHSVLATLEALRGRAALRVVVTSILATVCLGGAVACVGWQSQLRARFLADVDQLEQLKRLVPSPPRDALFVPVEIADGRPAGLRRFDPGVYGAMAQPWSCWAYVQRGYHRSDISATHLRPGQKPPISADARGVRYPRGDGWR